MKILLDALKLAGEDMKESFSVADLLTEDHELVYVNDRFADETGYPKEDVIGRNCRFLQGEKTDREMVANIKEAVTSRTSCFFDLVNYKKDGSPFWNRLLLIPFGISDEAIRYFVGIQMDVTNKHENFDEKVPYACFDPHDNEIKARLEEIVNYYRSFRYFEEADYTSSGSEKVKELAERSAKNLEAICEAVRSL